MHIHVSEAGREAKFWLKPDVRAARKIGYKDREMRDLMRIVEANRDLIEGHLNEFFGNA